jgi:hypothetical protein
MKKGYVGVGNGKQIFDPELADMCERSNQRFAFVNAELDNMRVKYKKAFPDSKKNEIDYYIFNSIHNV